MFRQEKQYINITLPNNKVIRRRVYSRYVANNSPSWVIVGGVKFRFTQDMNGTYKLEGCYKSDFDKFWPRIFYTDRPKVHKGKEFILGVSGSCWDNDYYNIIVTNFFESVKR